MAICKKVGTPHLLITLTGSTEWPELQHMLRPGQPYCDRPDCCCRLFIDKLHELMKDIFNKHVMGPTLGGFYSIEHQKGYFVFNYFENIKKRFILAVCHTRILL
jgi:hypothetical protein